MEEDCYCNSFDGKTNYFSEFLKGFSIIASSNIKDKGNGLNAESTKILKCRKCSSYYIWDSYNKEYDEEDKISAKKYSPKINDDGLRKILGTVDGLINEKDIDDRSQLLDKLKKTEINRIFKFNESHN